MFRWLNAKRGQNTAEYAILIGVIVAAAIAMQVYVRRGMQSRVKDAVDYVSQADDNSGTTVFSANTQYEPYYLASDYTTTQQGTSGEAMQYGGGMDRSTNMSTQRTGNQTTAAVTATP